MKARIKATGEIVDIAEYSTIYAENHINCFYPNELEILDTSEDYWTRLEHQAAIAAMQQLVHLVNVGYEYVYEETAIIAMNFAHALVVKIKEKEERKE